MKKLILLPLLLIAMGLFAQEKTWAQFERYLGKNDSLQASPTVVFMGNSITDAWSKAHPEFFRQHNFAGRGISGQVSSQMLVRFQQDVIALNPKAVVILCGANDIALNNGYISLDHILQNIQSMCEIARFHRIKPIVCSVLPAKRFKWRPELKPAEDIRKLNEMIKAYAKENKIPYIDYHSAMTDEEGGLPAKYSADGVHPNPDGYTVMESIIIPALKKYL